jgi:microcystin-dependent protein
VSQPFLGEIKVCSFNFAPKGWMLCNGQLLPINQNQALFSLLGTSYGGDGRTTFALPNLRGTVPIHQGAGFTPGQRGGEENHTLALQELPAHVHPLYASSLDGDTTVPGNSLATPPTSNLLASPVAAQLYNNDGFSGFTSLAPGAIGLVGGSQPHTNMQPSLVLNFCIAVTGIFPSRN